MLFVYGFVVFVCVFVGVVVFVFGSGVSFIVVVVFVVGVFCVRVFSVFVLLFFAFLRSLFFSVVVINITISIFFVVFSGGFFCVCSNIDKFIVTFVATN